MPSFLKIMSHSYVMIQFF